MDTQKVYIFMLLFIGILRIREIISEDARNIGFKKGSLVDNQQNKQFNGKIEINFQDVNIFIFILLFYFKSPNDVLIS